MTAIDLSMYMSYINRATKARRENEMQKQEAKRKLRNDLTEEQREKAERIGSLSFRSHRDPFCRKMSIRVQYAGVGPKGRPA